MFTPIPYEEKKVIKKSILKKEDRELLKHAVYYLSVIAHAIDNNVKVYELDYTEDEIDYAKHMAFMDFLEEMKKKNGGD